MAIVLTDSQVLELIKKELETQYNSVRTTLTGLTTITDLPSVTTTFTLADGADYTIAISITA